jgi:predicted NBD/HSP70 family sugar kinase
MLHRPSQLPVTRQLSLQTVVECLLHRGPISRADMSKATGLSKQTISDVVGDLESGGWARQTGRTRGGIGRTAVTYEIRKDAAYVVGVELGGTKVSAALADLACAIVTEATEATDPRGGVHVVRQVKDLVEALAREAGAPPSRLRLAVVGTPGVLDRETGAIGLVPNIGGLDAFNVVAALERALGAGIVVENDVNLAVLGERWRGCADGVANVAFIALGTGIGMGLVVGGGLVRGGRGAAGEICFLPIGGDPYAPEARTVGALEMEIGTGGILRRYHAAGGPNGSSVRDVFERLAAGDEAAEAAVRDTARTLALAVAAVVALVDPDLVVLGGSIGVRPELVERVRAELARVLARPVPVEPSRLGTRAGLMGALAVALSRMHNDLFGVRDLRAGVPLPPLAAETPRAAGSPA